ncbi:MAG TPA: kynureninase [Gemmatales bacterium]|nr:kynureninase [Gemmatales bacterium]
MDRDDVLSPFRGLFHIPRDGQGRDEIYFCGNSLGLQPRRTTNYVNEFLVDWAAMGVRGHFEGKHPWLPYHEFLTDGLASLAGAERCEIVAMNSLTVNLHLMMVSFYRPTTSRYKILIEEHAFPSDTYAVDSHLRHLGLDPARALVKIAPRPGEELIRDEDLFSLIKKEAGSLAFILLPGVQYYTGQMLPMAEIVNRGHAVGAVVGFDLAHAMGNVLLSLHDWNVDFAVWCSYKYLNSGAGSVAGCFIHECHVKNTALPRFAGWWGHDKATRFEMGSEFHPIPTAEGWQLSNPPILSLAAIRASLEIFNEAGGMPMLRSKSEKLTGYLEYLLNTECEGHIDIITPADPAQRGCQLSLSLRKSGDEVHKQLEASGVGCDWREPNVIRVAPVPLYNSFEEVHRFVHLLKGRL